MLIKVCGMRDPDNISRLSALDIHWMGFIFYGASKRFTEYVPETLPGHIKKVGVFVDADGSEVWNTVKRYGLDMVQLHGSESPALCWELRQAGIPVIKAFAIETEADLQSTVAYEGCCNYYLFDTKCAGYGGSGKRFDWSVLSAYKGETPFLLSGGINPDSLGDLTEFAHPYWVGVDLNSGFETTPGMKEVDKLKEFVKSIKKLRRMNRITTLFKTRQNNILSVYFTAGYPNLNDTTRVLKALQQKGINLVEIGIPFSDPMADGPVIQESSTYALRNGMSLRVLFDQLRDIREEVNIPLILMGYLNPIMQYGFENFCRSCAECGIDGVIIPDLPFADYLADYKETAEKYNVKVVMLITPETSEERIRLIDAHTDGFIYMVSSASTTGAQQSFTEQKQDYFRRINSMQLRNPRLIGFGISNKATFDAACSNASGGIVGSKFVQLLGSSASPEMAVDKLLEALNS